MQKLQLLLITLVIFLSQSAMDNMHVDVHKIPKTTMVHGTARADLDSSFKALLGTLCDYDIGASISDDDPVDFQVTVSGGLVTRLEEELPDDLDKVAAMGRTSSDVIHCPGGENYVLAVLDLPWPISNAWQISRFRTSISAPTRATAAVSTMPVSAAARIYYDFLAGTAKQSSGYWNIRELANGRAELTNHFEFDVGFRLPEFLIRWGVRSALPDFFEAIEAYAVAHHGKYDSPSVGAR